MRLTNWLANVFARTRAPGQPGSGAINRRKRGPHLPGIEGLEARTLLTTELTLSGGALVVTDIAAGGQDDTLTITSDSTNSKYVISDPTQTFIATGIAGAVISGDQHSVDVPFISVAASQIVVNTQGGSDIVTASAVGGAFQAGLTINGGAGADTVSLNNSVTFANGKSLVVNADTFNTGAAADIVTSGAGFITIAADNVELNLTSTLVSPNTITITQQTAGRNISLAQETAGELSLTDEETDRITAGTLVFGDELTGSLLVYNNGFSPAGTSTLRLNSSGSTNGSSIVVDNLAMTAGIGIIYYGDVQNIAAFVASGSISINDTNGLTVTSVAGVDGVVKQPGSGPGGISIDLASGNFAVLDTPAADDMSAQGVFITLAGSAAFSTAAGSIVHSTGGSFFTITADEMALLGTLQGDTDLRLQPRTAGVQLVLGTNPVSANTLELSAAEIALLDLPGYLYIGRNVASPAGDITITSPIVTAASHLHLETGGGIIDANPTGIDLTAATVVMKTGTGIGVTGADQTIETSATELGVENLISGDALVLNTNNVILNSGSVAGLKNNGGSISIINNGNITALLPITVGGTGNITLDAQGTSSEIRVQSLLTSASGNITLRADDDIMTVGSIGGIASTSGNLFFYPDDDASGAGTMSFHRPINLGSGTATVNAPNYLGGITDVISGTGNFVKTGAGAFALSGANTYSGTTSIEAGQLLINGAFNSTTTVSPDGTLGGNGTISSAKTLTVQSGGSVVPGQSPGTSLGILTAGNTIFNSGSFFNVELYGTELGTPFDQLKVTGTIALGNATLNVAMGVTPTIGDSYIIIDNDGEEAITGTFNGLAEGDTFSVDGQLFQITYRGGTGNDAVLTYQPPEVSSLLDLGGPAVTWIKKQPPVTVLPQLAVTNGVSFAGGTLTLSIATIGTKKKALDQLVIPTITFGTTNTVSRTPTLSTITIHLGADDTAAEIQAFLRGIHFSTKGKGLKTLVRTMNVTLADNDGHSTHIAQTIHIFKKTPITGH